MRGIKIASQVAGSVSGVGLSVVGLVPVAQTWAQSYPWVVLAMGAVAAAGPLVGVELDPRKRAIGNYLKFLHRRSWKKDGGRDADVRLSIFTKMAFRNRLKCLYRTDERHTSKTWSIEAPSDGRDYDGIAACIWKTGMSPLVAGIRDGSTAEIARYCSEAHLTEEIYKTMSWKGCAITGWQVSFSPNDPSPAGVLLVERKAPCEPLTPQCLEFEAEICKLIMEGTI